MNRDFPKSRRLVSPEEFQAVYDRKCSAADRHIVVYRLGNELGHPRLGVSVSKKVGNAVVRNRVKRLFREAFRHVQDQLGPGDLIMIPRGQFAATVEELQASLVKLAAQLAARQDRK
jgi:ribonuclease P protein component